jgi:F420-dependent oxidoreductase-like protein
MDLGVQVEPQFGFTYDDIVAIAREAERAGFRAVWLSDHLLLDKDAVATNCLEAWTVLAALAVETKRIRIGPMVSAQSYRNPALLAKMAAGVDQISGGRLEFGLGAGWKEVEYASYGYEFRPPGVRVTQLREALEICTRLWSKDRATYRGKHYRIEDAVCAPKPAQRPLPIWIGGTKPRVMRVAAKYAHWFNLSNPGTPIAERLPILRDVVDEACRAVGRDPATLHRSIFVQLLAAQSRSEIDEIVRELARRAKVTAETWRASRRAYIVGTTDEVGEQLRTMARAGVEHVNAMLPYQFEVASIRALATLTNAL